jgi:hypothetical protein
MVDESFGKPVGRLAFRKLAKAFDLLNAELTESRFWCKALSESLKKARLKKRKAIEIGVQDAFVQMMDVRKVKVSMGAIPDTPTPVLVAEGVEDEGDESSIIVISSSIIESHPRCWRLRSADQLPTGLMLSGAPGPPPSSAGR